jgi:hypothetical protein
MAILGIGLTGLIFATVSFVLVVLLYVFYFTRFQHEPLSRNMHGTIIVIRLASTVEEQDIDINNPSMYMDGTLLSINDLILLKNQTDMSLNGIYTINKGRGISPYQLVKVPSMEGSLVLVKYGIENQSKMFVILFSGEDSGRIVKCSNKSIDVKELTNFKYE